MDDINNFDEFKKLKDFENSFLGFSSKRGEIENTEITWANNNFTGTDPDVIDRTFDDFENTIFNNNYSFKIGGNIYELRSDGMYINGVYQARMANSMKTTDACIRGKDIKPFEPTGTDRRYRLKVAVHDIFIRSSAKGKVVSFKPKSGGGWKRSRSEMAVGIYGQTYAYSCYGHLYLNARNPVSTNDYKKRRQLKRFHRETSGVGGLKTKPNELYSKFELPLPSGYYFATLYLD